MKPYKTLMRDADETYWIQKSRFIGRAAPVCTAEAALAFLEGVRLEHRAANHHCYAYIIGSNAGIMRYSDDGEPGGTAGLPMMEVLKSSSVVDCVAVVTRYFGGVLLGAGGLMRAYRHTCTLALHAAGICEMVPTQRWHYEVPYPVWDRVQHTLGLLPIRIEDTAYAATVQFTALSRQHDSERVNAELERVTDGRLSRRWIDESYIAWEETAATEA